MGVHNFQRPSLPYENESLQNDKRYQLLTRSNKRPPTDQMLDTDINYLIDAVRQLDDDVVNVDAGILSGADNPDNANLFPTTDGDSHISWTDVSDINVRDRSLSGVKLLPQTITAFEMMDGTLTAPKLASNCVTTVKILDFNVTANKLAPDSVTTIKILDENVTTPKLADEAVTAQKLSDDAVTAPKILDGNITTPKIADSNVTTQKIADLNVTTSKLADGSVTLPKIGPNVLTPPAVKADQMAANSTAVYTNPSVQQHHPSAAKFWCVFDGTLTGTNPPSAGYNVASVTRTSLGTYQVNFIVPFSTNQYCVSIATSNTNSAQYSFKQITALNVGSCSLLTGPFPGGGVADCPIICVTGFGLQ